MDNSEFLYKTRCLQLIEEKLNWGDSANWSNHDFEKLSTLIHERTHVLLSISTLKRIWGKVKYTSTPTTSTMDALAGFLGYENWRSFVAHQHPVTPTEETPLKAVASHTSRYRSGIMWLGAIALLLSATWAFIYKKNRQVAPVKADSQLAATEFTFSSKPVARGLPNSVIFTYDATKSPTDSVFIQQNWDPMRRKLVDKNGHTHTSIYYEPGHYNAKLVIGNQVVQEHSLLVPTDGWLGTIDHSPSPIYLNVADFIKKDQLDLSKSVLEKHKLDPLTERVGVKYYNVGNFDPIPINDFSFSAQIKNTAEANSDPCKRAGIGLFTETMPISFPLSIKGCVSDLTVASVDGFFSGKEHDLSKFGTDLSQWVDVKCVGTDKSIQYYVNNELAYEAPLISDTLHVLGMVYGFSGGGSVRNVRLSSADKIIFQAF